MPTVTRMIDRMVQASTTHADFVHARIVLSLSFQGISAGFGCPERRGARTDQEGKDLGGWHLRQAGSPDRKSAGMTGQPQENHGGECEQRGQKACESVAVAAAAAGAATGAGTTGRVAVRTGLLLLR